MAGVYFLADCASPAAAQQSNRCFPRDCPAHGACKLERCAAIYGAEPSRFAGQRLPYEVIGRECAVRFEPGKCIKCELCIKVAERAAEPLGPTFVGRGFDVQLAVPFGRSMDAGLSRVAAECVAAWSHGRPLLPSPGEVKRRLLRVGRQLHPTLHCSQDSSPWWRSPAAA